MVEIKLREASINDIESVQHLLTTLNMRTQGILEPNTRYWVTEISGEVVGVIGVELGDKAGLLRSAAIIPEHRNRGIGKVLVEHLLDACAASGHRTIYCFSTVAGEYWQQLGFWEVPVSEVAQALPTSPQVILFKHTGELLNQIAWRKNI